MAIDLNPGDLDGIKIVVEGHDTFHEGEGSAHFAYIDGWVHAEFWVDRDGIRITQLTLEPNSPYTGDIDGQFLRAVSIPSCKAAIMTVIEERYPIQRRDIPGEVDWSRWREEWPNGDQLDMLLKLVTVVYNKAVDREQPARMAVANQFGVSRATAGRMISAAREAGNKLRSPAPYPGKRKGTSNDGEDSTRDR